VTLRIETTRDDASTVLRLIGRIDSQDVGEIAATILGDRRNVTLDLEEVTLVDMDAVRFLLDCESQGIALRHCLPYIRAWLDR
jgi:anti-anti-sigma regulatory factor